MAAPAAVMAPPPPAPAGAAPAPAPGGPANPLPPQPPSGGKTSTQAYYNKNIQERHIKQFERFLTGAAETGVEGLLKEYDTEIRPYFPTNMKRQVFDMNASKNRYKDVICNDNTRVVLRDKAGGDYIHANHVWGEPLPQRFICTQGPTSRTVHDFWRMIVQEKVTTAFMLCDLIELGKKKCEKYWPEKQHEKVQVGDFTILNANSDTVTEPGVIITTLTVSNPAGKIIHSLKHYQWKGWPDRSVPKNLLTAFRMLKYSRGKNSMNLVHCSAGVGRTGTFVAMEIFLQRLFSPYAMNRVDLIKRLRNQRMHALQVDVQYIFIIIATIEYGKVQGLLNAPPMVEAYNKIMTEYNTMLKTKAPAAVKTKCVTLVPLDLKECDAEPQPYGDGAPSGAPVGILAQASVVQPEKQSAHVPVVVSVMAPPSELLKAEKQEVTQDAHKAHTPTKEHTKETEEKKDDEKDKEKKKKGLVDRLHDLVGLDKTVDEGAG